MVNIQFELFLAIHSASEVSFFFSGESFLPGPPPPPALNKGGPFVLAGNPFLPERSGPLSKNWGVY